MIVTSTVAENLERLQKRIEEACQRSGREASEIQVVLVTKMVSAAKILEAYDWGARKFGENRVQEFLGKVNELPRDIEWHFVGHLQTNKVESLIRKVSLVHSLDSLRLAAEIEKQSKAGGVKTPVLIQVNTSGERSKFGLSSDDVPGFVSQIKSTQSIEIKGLMTIAPLTSERSKIREAFQKLRDLRTDLEKKFPELEFPYLSMGMSQDFEVAIEEGANLLRIGTAVFGERRE